MILAAILLYLIDPVTFHHIAAMLPTWVWIILLLVMA